MTIYGFPNYFFSDLKMKLSGIFPRYEHYKKAFGAYDYEISDWFTARGRDNV